VIEARSGVFVSYSSADRKFARRLAANLQGRGARIWFDEGQIDVGDSLIEKLRDGIDRMEFLLVVLSPDSVRSEWVRREVDVAMTQEIEGKRIKVLPVLYRQCDLPGFLKGKRYADFTDSLRFHDSLTELLRRLSLHEIPSPFGSEPEVNVIRLAEDRLRGSSSVATRLSEISSGEALPWRSVARLELAYHEFARLGDCKALPVIQALATSDSRDPFVNRAFALLASVCLLANGESMAAARAVAEAPPCSSLTPLQRGFLALHEGIAALGLGNPHETDLEWKHAASLHPTSSSEIDGYPLYAITKPFDRAVIRTLVGRAPVSKLVERLLYSTYRGAAHQSAMTARAIRKADVLTRQIEQYGRTRKWEHLPSFPQMKKRLREYEVSLLSMSGTLFAPQVPGLRDGAAG